MAPASAVGPIQANNLVNVNISGNTVTVPVSVAASLAVTACDLVDVSGVQVAVLSRATLVDRTGREQTICRTDAGDVTITNDIVN
jgi:xanthine/uracil/vitamin C permease (AzgA family)